MQRLSTIKSRIAQSDVLMGLCAVMLVAIIGAVATYFYVSPPGRQEVTFTTHDANSLTTGVDVRVAGISVGEVKNVDLRANDVEVTLDVDKKVRIGDRSRIEVHLLTAVGGYFVVIKPAGALTDTSTDIPMNRVTVPYTIADTLQEVPRVTDNVEGVDIGDIAQQISAGLQGNSRALGQAVGAMQSLATIMDKQKSQVESILSLTSEYTTTFHNSQDFVMSFIRDLNTVFNAYYVNRVGFSQAWQGLGSILARLEPIATFYLNHSDEFYGALSRLKDEFGNLSEGMQTMMDNLGPLRDRLVAMVKTGNTLTDVGKFTVDASTMCIPLPDKAC